MHIYKSAYRETGSYFGFNFDILISTYIHFVAPKCKFSTYYFHQQYKGIERQEKV